MNIFIFLIGLYVFTKTISYGLYEIKNNNNKFSGILVIVIGTFSAFFPNIILLLN